MAKQREKFYASHGLHTIIENHKLIKWWYDDPKIERTHGMKKRHHKGHRKAGARVSVRGYSVKGYSRRRPHRRGK